MNETAQEAWWLVAQLPPNQVGTALTIDFQREISGEELHRVQEANEILQRLAHAAPYAQLVNLFRRLAEASMRREGRSATRTASDMNRAVLALSRVAADLAGSLREQVNADFGAESEEAHDLQLAINDESERPPFQVLVAVSRLGRGIFESTTDDRVVNDLESVTALANELSGVTPAINFLDTLGRGVIVAQRLIGRQLEIYKQRVEAASLLLRQLAAEVPDGAVAIMRSDPQDEASSKESAAKLTPVPLALDSALALHRAIRHSGDVLARTERSVASVSEDPQDGDTVPDAVGTDTCAETSGQRPVPSETKDSGEPEQAESPAEAPPSANDHPLPRAEEDDQIVDIRALATNATQLADSLERAWSSALRPDELQEAFEEMQARIESLVRSVQRRVEVGDRSLRQAGVDTRLRADPLPLGEVRRLSFEPDPQRRWLQLQIAELEALRALLEAFQAMRAPSAQKIMIPSGEVETWWESGGFSLLRTRARALARLSDETAAASEALAGKPSSTITTRTFFDSFLLATEAWSNGDPVGALCHIRLALRQRSALEHQPVPTDLTERLAAQPRITNQKTILHLLDEAAARVFQGGQLDIGAATLLARPAITLVRLICLEEPEIMRSALTAAGGTVGEPSGSTTPATDKASANVDSDEVEGDS